MPQVIISVANTSQKHRQQRNQKRKDRQLSRQQKNEEKAKLKHASNCNQFMADSVKAMKGASKSLPGFLAKHSSTICRWLDDYCMLFQKADDAYIDYFKLMDRDKRNQLIQDYVDIRVFLSTVQQLSNKCSNADASYAESTGHITGQDISCAACAGEV